MSPSLKSTKFQIHVKCFNSNGEKVFRKASDIALSDHQTGFCLTNGFVSNNTDPSISHVYAYPYTQKALTDINVIKIVIFDTKLKRAPVVKSIEIWGNPSYTCSESDIEEITKLIQNDSIPDIITVDTSERAASERACNEELENFKIPEEFLDALTNELLVQPYCLPSGNVVDLSSIEKHNQRERSYGRYPSDPFTGVIYSSAHKPVFDASLKARLDEFKLCNSLQKEVRYSGRTAGKLTTNKNVPSASTGQHVSKKIKIESNSSIDDIISSIYKSNQITIFTKPNYKPSNNSLSCQQQCDDKSCQHLYRIQTCSHCFCKNSLLNTQHCPLCKIPFQLKDVSKINI